MLRAERMQLVNVVTFDTDVDCITKAIIDLELMQLLDITPVKKWSSKLKQVNILVKRDEYIELAKRIQSLFSEFKITSTSPDLDDVGESFDQWKKEVDVFQKDITPLVLQKQELQAKKDSQTNIYNQLRPLLTEGKSFSDALRFTYLENIIGKIPEDMYSNFEKELIHIPHILVPFNRESGMVFLMVFVLKKDKVVIDSMFSPFLFEKLELSSQVIDFKDNIDQKLEEEIKGFEQELEDVDHQIQLQTIKVQNRFVTILKKINEFIFLSNAKKYYKKTERTYMVSGWVPLKQTKPFVDKVIEVSKGNCFIETYNPEDIEAVREGKIQIPVEYLHPAFLQPFEGLVTTYGIPEYNTIDPTLFVALSFLIMFGAMFGDVGHGLIIFLIGVIAIFNKKKPMKQFGMFFGMCGVSSIIFGFLYGSIFGNEAVLKPLWISPMHNINYLIQTAIFFGVAVISIGIIINIINGIIKKDFYHALLERTGLLGGIIYWICIVLIVKIVMLGNTSIGAPLILTLIGIPLVIFFFKAPIAERIGIKKKHEGQNALEFVLESLIEMLELFLGFLANTVSFMRVAAFALAHVGLFLAIFSLANVLKSAGGDILWILVHIFGNILVILLEGLIVSIQCIRLEYYEFFSKFFESGGQEFKPIKKNKLSL